MSSRSSTISKKLERQKHLIASMCCGAGIPGVAISVIHDHQIVFEEYQGHRDVEQRLPVDRDTIFYIASLTKGMTAAALGILVDRGQLQWDTPVHDILPEMSKDTDTYAAKLTVVDILSHRTGKAWADALYLESNNKILLGKEQSIPIFDYLTQLAPVRSKYMYNNHAYNIAGLVIERISGESWSTFVAKHLFNPLGMTRTFTQQPEDKNVAIPYNILSDRSAFRLPFCNASGQTMMFAGQSVRTSMSDLMKYSAACLRSLETMIPSTEKSAKSSRGLRTYVSRASDILGCCRSRKLDIREHKRDISVKSPIKEICTIARPHVPRPVESILEQTYALGWNRTQLPGSLDFGWNQCVLNPYPLLGRGYPNKLVLWHGGNMPGTTAAICLLPESGTAVVVMHNSLGPCDVADWICQLIIDVIFMGKPAQDYLSLVSQCVEAGFNRMAEVERCLSKARILGTTPRNLNSYTGRYLNVIKNWFIDIKLDDDGLYLEFLGLAKEQYRLRHYHYNVFAWNLSYDELVKRAQYIRPYEYYLLKFEFDDEGETSSRLSWKHDKSVSEGELFYKSSEASLDVSLI